jgi:hypothetical protein
MYTHYHNSKAFRLFVCLSRKIKLKVRLSQEEAGDSDIKIILMLRSA